MILDTPSPVHTTEASITNLKPILSVRNACKVYGEPNQRSHGLTGPAKSSNICPETSAVIACHNINLDLYPGEVLGIVGESGSGKSTLLKMLNFDVPADSGELTLNICEDIEGIPFDLPDHNVFALGTYQKRSILNHYLGTVYQHPHLGLRMGISAGGNIAEKLIQAGDRHVGRMRDRASELLTRTEVPVNRMDELPSTFSGGMQQRVQIAKALSNTPRILLLDEVTTGLDVSVQARVLDLIRDLQRDLKVAMLVVSHDLGVIRTLTSRTLVMKNGHVVESGLTDQILEDPQHPYTQLLVTSALQ